MDPLEAKANYSRVCQLLIDKGGDALRRVLQTEINISPPPSTLDSLLSAHKKFLQKLRYSVINVAQWKLLYPASGPADANSFDITLLTILLRNICGLPSPAARWSVMPPASDTSVSAEILRIKMFRNEVYGHISSAQFNETEFEKLWEEISKPLVKLGITQHDIDKLKEAPLSSEEESYIEKLKEWKKLEDDLVSKISDLQEEFKHLRTVVENINFSKIDELAKFDFTGKIINFCKKFQDGTRQWFFDKLATWFRDKESNVMILTAGPGVGKSVLSAKVCELYQESGELAACHFCDFRTSDYRDPHRILESLASQMCDNVDGFREKLNECLRRKHSRESLPDACRVLLNDPLHTLRRCEPMLIVVDALDESNKSEFLEVISAEFFELPKWIKIFISSRPELQVRKKLEHLNRLEILPNHRLNNLDLKQFIQRWLPNIDDFSVKLLISKCEGSFLYAYFLVNELNQIYPVPESNVNDFIPKSIAGFYEKQFKRSKTDLQSYEQNTGVSIFKSFINVVAASREPLPFRILFTCMGLSGEEFEIRETIVGIMSEILPVYDDCLTVFHKSLWDWLTLDGYEEHAYAADVADGNKRLWRACKKVYMNIDSLCSVSDFQISPEKRYALYSGWKHLLCVGEVEDLIWLANVKINFLKLKFRDHEKKVSDLYADFFDILWTSDYNFSKHLYWCLNQLYTFFKFLHSRLIRNSNNMCYIYLQYLANAHIGFVPNNIICKNTARAILDQTNTIWLEEVKNETDSSFKIISDAVCAGYSNHKVGRHTVVSSSPDNQLLAWKQEKKLQVFELPSLKSIFQLDVHVGFNSLFIEFSPDSSYFLLNSLQTCVSVKEQKPVPFIPHGPTHIDSCSFSSCGAILVTAEEKSIKLWDVRKKELLRVSDNKLGSSCEVFFSSYDSYIVAFNSDISVLESTSLELLDVEKLPFHIPLTYDDCVQLICSSAYEFSATVQQLMLPTGENILLTNKYFSQPFSWEGRKCVLSSNSYECALSLILWDIITQEVVDTFQIGCLPSYNNVDYISNLGGSRFVICVDDNFVFVLSLHCSSDSFVPPFTKKIDPTFCVLSPDNLYVACHYGYPLLAIRSVDNGKTLQTIAPVGQPMVCWWSKLHLWVVCEGPMVIKYPYDVTQTKVLANDPEFCMILEGYVLKFSEGVLVVVLEDCKKISISKVSNEKLSPQQLLDSNFNVDWCLHPEVAVSSDGCCVLLYRDFDPYYELWEMACNEIWQLVSSGKVNCSIECDPIECVSIGDGLIDHDSIECDLGVHIQYVFLTGARNCRSSLWLIGDVSENFGDSYLSLHPLYLSSIDFPKGNQSTLHDFPEFLTAETLDIIYAQHNLLVFHQESMLYFIDLSAVKVVASIYVGRVDHFFLVPEKAILLLFRGNVITHLKIHNIDAYLPFH